MSKQLLYGGDPIAGDKIRAALEAGEYERCRVTLPALIPIDQLERCKLRPVPPRSAHPLAHDYDWFRDYKNLKPRRFAAKEQL